LLAEEVAPPEEPLVVVVSDAPGEFVCLELPRSWGTGARPAWTGTGTV